MSFTDILGNIGIICFLSAYFLLQKGRLPPTGLGYLGLNLAGSILLMVSLVFDWNLPAFLLEAAWALISIYGIYRHIYLPGRKSES
jgi:hypothetical protein